MNIGLETLGFAQNVIRPALKEFGIPKLETRAAEILLLGTALTESRLRYLRQINGPALGLYQMEPNTYRDIYENFLKYQFSLYRAIEKMRYGQPDPEQMVWNLRYATAMARVHYFRVPAPLPKSYDAAGMAEYHKRFYNTPLGATDPNESIKFFQQAIDILGKEDG